MSLINMWKTVLITAILIFSTKVLAAQEKVLELLPGTWISESDSAVREIWWLSNEEWHGRSVKLNAEGEEEIWEKLRIFYSGDSLIYESYVVEDQKRVRFPLKRKDKNELLFSNPQHDFPKFIHYRWRENGQMITEVYSQKGGKRVEFQYFKDTSQGQPGH